MSDDYEAIMARLGGDGQRPLDNGEPEPEPVYALVTCLVRLPDDMQSIGSDWFSGVPEGSYWTVDMIQAKTAEDLEHGHDLARAALRRKIEKDGLPHGEDEGFCELSQAALDDLMFALDFGKHCKIRTLSFKPDSD